MRKSELLLMLMLVSAGALAQDDAAEEAPEASSDAGQPAGEVKTMSGMSVLGNEEAPKSLVIVPWKSSRLGDGLGVENSLDERPRPLDKEVFSRELRYYTLRSGSDE